MAVSLLVNLETVDPLNIEAPRDGSYFRRVDGLGAFRLDGVLPAKLRFEAESNGNYNETHLVVVTRSNVAFWAWLSRETKEKSTLARLFQSLLLILETSIEGKLGGKVRRKIVDFPTIEGGGGSERKCKKQLSS